MNLYEKNESYYKAFFVGLMDGDGSIQVNHWRKRTLQFRVIIALKYSLENFVMLQLLTQKLGVGNVVVVEEGKKGKRVLWVENHQKKMQKVLQIFEDYPPFTSRLTCQLEFFKKQFLYPKSMEDYFENRKHKYRHLDLVQRRLKEKNVSTFSYFPSWLSGFIEAEGCFCNRFKSNCAASFSIFQKTDSFLMDAIRDFIGARSRVRFCSKREGYSLDVYRQDVFIFLIEHFQKYPLLGAKRCQFEQFVAFLKSRNI